MNMHTPSEKNTNDNKNKKTDATCSASVAHEAARNSVLFCMILYLGNVGNVGKNLGKIIKGTELYFHKNYLLMYACVLLGMNTWTCNCAYEYVFADVCAY
jgi:hypothetical protein